MSGRSLCFIVPCFYPSCQLTVLAYTTDGLGAYRLQTSQPYGVELALLASIVLGGASIPRAIRLKKPVPIGLSIMATYGLLQFGTAFFRKQ